MIPERIFTIILLCLLCIGLKAQHQMMPVPTKVEWGQQRFQLDKGFYVVLSDEPASRASKGVDRFLRRLDNRTHLLIAKNAYQKVSDGKSLPLLIQYQRIGKLMAGEDESYKLIITGDQALLEATTDLGVLRGLETILQLVSHDSLGHFLPGVIINDAPRFPWRGLLIDVCRHFSPMDVLKRNIDGMAMVKMNVLHLHLSEDQGFRIESKKFPKLHLMGSNGDYYTQDQMREIIAYAGERGIRVIPEFDMPGHATSWMVGYPELASAPGPYQIEKKFGVFDPTMDPTKKSTYKFLKKFIAEMTAIFPDAYFHIGGDENNGKQWDNNKSIQEFMKKNEIKNNHELQNYFNKKVFEFVTDNKKKMIGWDEILQPGLSDDAVIQSWRGKEGLKDAAVKGYSVILSNGYYIDLVQPARKYYLNDPLPKDIGLTAEQQKYVLGGEATMWAELVTPETIDSRIWPVTAAIAERLWSEREVNDVDDMYRRLESINFRLEEVGLQHIKNQDMMLRRIADGKDIAPLKKLISIIEPLKDYSRHSQGLAYNTDLPFTRMPDIALPESQQARGFNKLIEKYIKKPEIATANEIEKQLNLWIENHVSVVMISENNRALTGWSKMSEKLVSAAMVCKESIDLMRRQQVITDEWIGHSNTILQNAKLPVDECELPVIESIIKLFHHTLPK